LQPILTLKQQLSCYYEWKISLPAAGWVVLEDVDVLILWVVPGLLVDVVLVEVTEDDEAGKHCE